MLARTLRSSRQTPSIAQAREPLEALDSQPITARLAAAASRRVDLEALLAAAPPEASVHELRQLVLEQNVAGKASAVARRKLWSQLRERYLLDRSVPECATFLAGMASTSSPTDRGLLCALMMARTDRLFREMALRSVSPYLSRNGSLVPTAEVQQALEAYLQEHELTWSADTKEHVRQHLMASLKDFGVLRGSKNKRPVRPRPGPRVTLLAARFALLEGLSPRQLLDSRWFRLLGLDREQVVDLLYAAAREGVLEFRMQAEVIELRLPDQDWNTP